MAGFVALLASQVDNPTNKAARVAGSDVSSIGWRIYCLHQSLQRRYQVFRKTYEI